MKCRQDSKQRLPSHDAIIEVKAFDVCQNPVSAFRDVPLGIFLLMLCAG